MMILRLAEQEVRTQLECFPAVALIGPRQVGKTTLAMQIAKSLGERAVYLDLELPSDLAKLSDAELYLAGHRDRLVILDEVHRKPGLFQTLRGLIDRRRLDGDRAGHFLLLGFASVKLLKQSAESLAGRINYIELAPFILAEVAPVERNGLTKLWNRGGFPDSFLAVDDSASLDWRRAFIQTYLKRDIPDLGPRAPAETLRRFWTMLAHNQGQVLNAARLASGLGVSGRTVARYLDTLVGLLLARRLEPWLRNAQKRLVRSPKTYLRDSGILHALLRIGEMEELLGHPIAGPSWEGWVIENLLNALSSHAQPYFYRSHAGAEIDLVLDLGGRGRWAIEIKRSLAPKPSRGFYIACDDIEATRRLVIYPGEEAYNLDAQTEVIPAAKLSELAIHGPGASGGH